MPLNVNNVAMQNINVNGVAMTEVKVNGVTVWSSTSPGIKITGSLTGKGNNNPTSYNGLVTLSNQDTNCFRTDSDTQVTCLKSGTYNIQVGVVAGGYYRTGNYTDLRVNGVSVCYKNHIGSSESSGNTYSDENWEYNSINTQLNVGDIITCAWQVDAYQWGGYSCTITLL